MQGGARCSAPVQSACRGYPRALWRSVLNWSRVWGLGVWAVISSLRAAAGHTGTTLSAASRRGTWNLRSPPHCVHHQLLEATAGTQPRSRPPGGRQRAASAGVPAHEVPAVSGVGRYQGCRALQHLSLPLQSRHQQEWQLECMVAHLECQIVTLVLPPCCSTRSCIHSWRCAGNSNSERVCHQLFRAAVGQFGTASSAGSQAKSAAPLSSAS